MKKVSIVIGSMLIGLSILAYLSFRSATKTAYVNLSDLYNEFTMKKEMQKQLENIEQKRNFILDSMLANINAIGAIDEKGRSAEMNLRFEQEKNDYMVRQRQFEEDNMSTAKQYQEQIWKQINQYVHEFGDKNGYEYIFGADGSGAVMYAKKGQDITKDVLVYINNLYKGKK